MACINADGTLTGAAKRILRSMNRPITLEGVSQETMLPLYRIRANVREIVEAGLIEETVNGEYLITEAGRTQLEEQS
jgi:predicted transcriptional regulator